MSTEPTAGVSITLKDVYDLANQIRTDMSKTNTHVEMMMARNTSADALHTDHEQRLRSLEKWKYALPTSIILAIGSAVAVAIEAASKAK